MPKTTTTRTTDKISTKSSTQSSQKTKKIVKGKPAPTKAAKSASKPSATKKWPAQSPVAKKPMVGAGTKHIGTPKFSNEFAEICLCPGDPLRAKFIADNFLTNCKLIQ